jgi:hypothetical protein
MQTYNTMSEAIRGLVAAGYRHDFNLLADCVFCSELDLALQPDEFEIDEQHRFEGDSDPGDNNIVYAITSRTGVKGHLVNAYGVYADQISQALVSKLAHHSA